MADNFEKDFMRMMREKAAAKALLDPAQFKPDQSITNEQAKAMNLPEAEVEAGRSTKFIADDVLRREWAGDRMQVAASPVGGETPDEAYQTAAKMKADADKQLEESYAAHDDIYVDQLMPATVNLFKSGGIDPAKEDFALIQQAVDLLTLEEHGAIQLEPEFKKKLQNVRGIFDQMKAVDDKTDLKSDEIEDLRKTTLDLKEIVDPEVPKADYLMGFDYAGKLRKK